jgi:cobaltochelatase CobS
MHYVGGFDDATILNALTLNWPETARQRCGIKDVDPTRVKRRSPRSMPDISYSVRHAIFDYADGLASSGVGLLMIGPAGTGKGFLAKQIATARDLAFASIPLTDGASVSWLLGRHTPQGFVETPFLRAFRDGGAFLFDELDAGDPNMLIVVNDALANGRLDNPLTGEEIERHDDFLPMAAANTYGTGADADYTGRNRLDGATLDRWRMGRVKMDYDRDLERAIMGVPA